MRTERLLMIVGLEKDERATPFVIGAFNYDYMEDLPLEDYDDQIQNLKETWTMDPDDYEWREVEVEVKADFMSMFRPTILAEDVSVQEVK